VQVTTNTRGRRAPALAARLGRHARRLLRGLRLGGSELSVVLVSDREMRGLNRRWRGKDRPTDVLSFPLNDSRALGDVVISLQTARRQSREGGWPLAAELRRLLAHGILHCRGYDHGDARQARKMAAAERRLLGKEGMVGLTLAKPANSR